MSHKFKRRIDFVKERFQLAKKKDRAGIEANLAAYHEKFSGKPTEAESREDSRMDRNGSQQFEQSNKLNEPKAKKSAKVKKKSKTE